MQIIEMRKLEQLEECAKLQAIVWDMSPQDVLPTHLMKAYVDPDDPWGILLGAYNDNDELLGCCLSFPTSRSDIYLLHMIGVLQNTRHQKVGFKLIEKTKLIALNRQQFPDRSQTRLNRALENLPFVNILLNVLHLCTNGAGGQFLIILT